MKEYVELTYDGIKLYADPCHCTLTIDYFILDRFEDIVFYLNVCPNYSLFPHKKLKCLRDYLLCHLKQKADELLETYIDDNLYSFNSICKSQAGKFQYGFKYFGKNKDMKSEFHPYINFTNIIQGLVVLRSPTGYCTFDLIKWELIECIGDGYDGKKIPLLEAFYHDCLYNIIVQKQYDKGVAADIFNEITRINEYLENKKTVVIHLKSGKCLKFKKQFWQDLSQMNNAAQILNFMSFNDGNGLTCCLNGLFVQPFLRENIPVADIDYLSYRCEKLYLNVELLNSCGK